MSDPVDALKHPSRRPASPSESPAPASGRRSRAATLKDVAAHAGVGVVTASGVLNGSRSGTRVSEATRQRILEAAADLRYHPNHAARSLRHQRTGAIGVLFNFVTWPPVVSNPYEHAALEGILQGAGERGYQVLLFTADGRAGGSPMDAVRERRVDGVLLLAPLLGGPELREIAAMGIAAVSLSSATSEPGSLWVDIDNERGTTLAVDHLVSLGHRRIAHVTGPEDQISIFERRDAYLAAMERHGLAVPAGYLAPGPIETVRERTAALLALAEPPTAVVAWNDGVAVEVVEAAKDAGFAVPERLSVVGFDDDTRAGASQPPLTTLRHPVREICRAGTHLLADRIEEKAAMVPPRWLPELVVRGSTGPAPGKERR